MEARGFVSRWSSPQKRGCGFARNKPPQARTRHADLAQSAGIAGWETRGELSFLSRAQRPSLYKWESKFLRLRYPSSCKRAGTWRRWPAIPSVGLPTLFSTRCQVRARYSRGPRLPSSEPTAALCAARTSEMTDVGPVRDVSCPSCLDAFHLPQHGVVPLLAGVAVGVGSIHGELATVHVAEVLNVSPDGLFPA